MGVSGILGQERGNWKAKWGEGKSEMRKTQGRDFRKQKSEPNSEPAIPFWNGDFGENEPPPTPLFFVRVAMKGVTRSGFANGAKENE